MAPYGESSDVYGYSLGIRSADIYSEREKRCISKNTSCFYELNEQKILVHLGQSKDIRAQLHLPLLQLRNKQPQIPMGTAWKDGKLEIPNDRSLSLGKVLRDLTKSFFSEFNPLSGKEICLAVSLPLTSLIRCQLAEACENCGFYVKSVIPEVEAYACDAFAEKGDVLEESKPVVMVVFDDLYIHPFKVVMGNGTIHAEESERIQYGYEWLQSKVYHEYLDLCGESEIIDDNKKREYIRRVDRYLQTGERDGEHRYEDFENTVTTYYKTIKDKLCESLNELRYPVVFCGFVHETKGLKEYLYNHMGNYTLCKDINPSAARGAVRCVQQNRKVLNLGVQETISMPFKFGYQVRNVENVIFEEGTIPLCPKMEMWRVTEKTDALRLTFVREEGKYRMNHNHTIHLRREVTEQDALCFEVWIVNKNAIYYHVRVDSEILCPLTMINP